MRKAVLAGFLFFVVCTPLFAAAPPGCAQGVGESQTALWDGYTAEIAPAAADAAAAQCHAAIKSADGHAVFEISAPEIVLNEITGSDLNGDGKKDAVVESHRARGQCCYTYSVITPGETPALVREITTSVALSFEDKSGDGKIEIIGHDPAFQSFDGLPAELSPSPLTIFRLHGSTMYYVGQSYWPDYEKDIADVRNSIPKSRLEKFKAGNSNSTGVNGQQKSDALEGRDLDEARSVVLQIVLDYLYGGKGPEAWKTLQSMWPYPDYVRVRQLILQARSRGLLGEVNRQATKAAVTTPQTQIQQQ